MKKEYKNIFKLSLIVITSLAIVFYLRVLYKNYQEYELSIPVIGDTFKQIKGEEINNYILENPNTLIYMCTSNEDKCRSFEKDLKKYVKRNDLRESIMYLNLNDMDSNKLISKLKNDFAYSRHIKTYPLVLYFKNGKIIDHLDSGNKQILTISLFEDFIKMYEIGKNNE
ncbi:MAG: DUF6568 family protein [Bacilli bacterium]